MGSTYSDTQEKARGAKDAARPAQGSATAIETGRLHWRKVAAKVVPYIWQRQPSGAKWALGLALAATGAGKLALVVSPFFIGEAIDRLAAGRDAAQTFGIALIGFVLGYGLMRTLGSTLPLARDYIVVPIQQRAERAASRDALAHLHDLSVRFHEERRTGSLMQVVYRGVRSIDFLVRFLIFNIVPTSIEVLIGAVILSVRLNPLFGLIAAGGVAAYTVFTILITNWRVRQRREMNEADQAARGKAVDSLLNFDSVKAFTAESREVASFDREAARYEKSAGDVYKSLAGLNAGQAVIINTALLLTVLLAVWGVTRGQLNVGDVTAALLVMTNLFVPLNVLGFAYREIRQAFVDVESFARLLDEEPEVQDRPAAKPFAKRPSGRLEFDGVHFGYDARRPILKDVSFQVAPGEKLAIVGPTGAGKSTIAKLIFRYYDVSAGVIRLDGVDVRDVPQSDLRGYIGLVPQEATLFNDTIRANIAFGREGASQAEVEAAARKAALFSFIEKLPDGWDTLVGERGVKLSGGEKQRVAIARALVKDPPVLVLDEATSALDSATEEGIKSALDAAARGRTTIAIAHRLSTIADADNILVLDDGMVRERGTHKTLLSQGGAYADLWSRQGSASGADKTLGQT